MPPSETDEDGVAIESSKVKMASYYPYMGGCARHLHERIVALMHRLYLEPHQFTGLLHVHLNGNDMEESSGKQGGGAKQGRWPSNSKEIAELAAYLKLLPKAQSSSLALAAKSAGGRTGEVHLMPWQNKPRS